jgi:succinoglycan biosynthesis transport protein ExoP
MSTDEQQEDGRLHFLDYWRVIRSRKEIVLAVILLVVVTGVSYTLTLPKIYMANARIAVREDAMDMDVFERQYIAGYNPFFLKTQYEIIQSRPILYRVLDNLNLQQIWSEKEGEEGARLRREDAFLMLARSIRVNQYRDTSLIDIQVLREDREEAAGIANEIAQVYRDQRLNVKKAELKRALDALENELLKQQEIVAKAEDELEDIRKSLGVSTFAKGITPDRQRVAQMEADLISARVDMITRKARVDQVEKLDGEELWTSIMYILNDPTVVALRKQVVDAEVLLKQLLQNFGENHPQVQQVQAGLKELQGKLTIQLAGVKQGLRADYEVTKARYEALATELAAAKDLEIDVSREKILPFEKKERDVMVQRDILNALRSRVAQQNIEDGVPRTPVEVIEPAEAPPENRPVSPNLLLNVLLSILLGVVAGVGLAYFIEYLDTSVKTVDDVERYLGLPVLGVIPQKVRPLSEEGVESPHAEAYRVLRTNMQFTNKGVQGGAFAVVSGGVGEGKSTTLFNLAFVCAQLGDKVLVVDSDLRRPVQHTFVGLSNRFGLTNVLMRDVPLEEAIKATSIPNLHFLPSGKLPRAALGLLDSTRMRELVKSLKARYDYVFFDSPPIVGVSDASILASEVDGVLLVVQYRKYPRNISLRARRMLENVGTNVLGVVLNNINILRDDYYYYYHSYYSHTNQADEPAGSDGVVAAADKKEETL